MLRLPLGLCRSPLGGLPGLLGGQQVSGHQLLLDSHDLLLDLLSGQEGHGLKAGQHDETPRPLTAEVVVCPVGAVVVLRHHGAALTVVAATEGPAAACYAPAVRVGRVGEVAGEVTVLVALAPELMALRNGDVVVPATVAVAVELARVAVAQIPGNGLTHVLVQVLIPWAGLDQTTPLTLPRAPLSAAGDACLQSCQPGGLLLRSGVGPPGHLGHCQSCVGEGHTKNITLLVQRTELLLESAHVRALRRPGLVEAVQRAGLRGGGHF